MKSKADIKAAIMSRKWYLILSVLWVSVLMTVVPPLISVWVFKSDKPMIILTGSEFVSLLVLVVSAYFGANVYEKNVEYKNGVYDGVVNRCSNGSNGTNGINGINGVDGINGINGINGTNGTNFIDEKITEDPDKGKEA